MFISNVDYYLDNGVRRIGRDTAHVDITLHSDVSLLSPGGSPGVLDLPVVGGTISAITNNQNTVVEGSAAGGRGQNTSGVELEDGLVGLDGDGDGSDVGGGEESGLIAGRDINILGDGDTGLGDGLAGSIGGGVGIGGLSGESLLGDGVLEGVVHQTTRAPVVSVGLRAVNQLLLGEGDEASLGDEPSSFHGTGGGERPARTALSLVLDGGDGTLGDPVDRSGQDDVVSVGEVSRAGEIASDGLVAGEGLELLSAHVGKLVDSHGPGSSLGVVGVDGVDILLEDVESGEEIVVVVLLAELGNILNEQRLVLSITGC